MLPVFALAELRELFSLARGGYRCRWNLARVSGSDQTPPMFYLGEKQDNTPGDHPGRQERHFRQQTSRMTRLTRLGNSSERARPANIYQFATLTCPHGVTNSAVKLFPTFGGNELLSNESYRAAMAIFELSNPTPTGS
ncbi:MAG: hypothetical protein CMA10_04710 [Euryarchaeota archaeon]|nr:hypothetical protein [Euryarchaeota archaeon]